MSFIRKSQIPLLVISAILLGVIAWLLLPSPQPPSAPPATPTLDSPSLSILAAPPDWKLLEAFQETITRHEFEQLLTTIFTTGEAWRKVIEIGDGEALIATGNRLDSQPFHLRFAQPETVAANAPRHWRTAAELPTVDPEKPLADLHIAIDPGHIGGDWAKMEERWFVVGDAAPVREGNMTLEVANLLKPRLEALGAKVSLVRERLEPVTPIRPEALRSLAQEASVPEDSPAHLQRLAERLFYRTAEIRARALRVNQSLQPDLVVCLHFNAEAWGDPNQPNLIDRTHLHLLLNGAYNDDEVLLEDQRFALLHKLLQRTHDEETRVGASVADTFAEISGLPPYSYPPDSLNIRQVGSHPYLWARNLLANRLYECPVIFMEPYVMNSTIDFARIQAGDYEGVREIEGKMLPSIFAEYTQAVTEGLARYYREARKPAPDAVPTAAPENRPE
jgi:hypothetical protein